MGHRCRCKCGQTKQCEFGVLSGDRVAVVRWKKREGRVGGRRGIVGGEGRTGQGRGEYKTRLLRGGARLLKARSLVRVALCTPSSMSLLISISFYSRRGSFSSPLLFVFVLFVQFRLFLVILSLCHSFTIYSIPFSNASKVSRIPATF